MDWPSACVNISGLMVVTTLNFCMTGMKMLCRFDEFHRFRAFISEKLNIAYWELSLKFLGNLNFENPLQNNHFTSIFGTLFLLPSWSLHFSFWTRQLYASSNNLVQLLLTNRQLYASNSNLVQLLLWTRQLYASNSNLVQLLLWTRQVLCQ